MSLALLHLETERIAVRTRRSTTVSFVLHGLIFGCLLLFQRAMPETMLVTEITWIEPAALETAPEPVSPVAAERKPERVTPPPKPAEKEERFLREPEVAVLEPQPQSNVVSDRLKRKLKKLPEMKVPRLIKVASMAPTASVVGRSLAAAPTLSSSNTVLELKRDERSKSPALELKRSGPASPQSRLADVETPAINSRRALEPAKVSPGSGPGSGGMSGPAADRPLLSRVLPRYPEWAKREGVEASVSLYFVVLPSGSVKSNVLVQKTSGYDDFDREARQALLAWRFEPQSGANAGEQWGTITFNFRLTTLP